MLKYLLQRLLWAIPAILSVALLVLLLGEMTPGDWVAGRVESDPGRFSGGGKDQRKEVYERLRREYGLDLPVFYFSIKALSEPDTLRSIVPAVDRRLVSSILFEHGNWEEVSAYLHAKRDAEALVIQNPELAPFLAPLDQWNGIEAARRQWNVFGQLGENDNNISAIANRALAALKKTERKATPWKNYVPVLSWNGTANRYHKWLLSLLQGNFGKSFRDGQEVNEKIGTAVSQTLWVTVPAITLIFIISIWVGKVLSRSRFSFAADLSSTSLYMLDAMPLFWICLLFILTLVLLDLHELLPFFEMTELYDLSPTEKFFSRLKQLIFPVICLVLSSIPYVTKQVEFALRDVYPREFITTARAKGASEARVIWKHAFRNALIPLITLISLFLPAVFAGSLVVEALFAIPGVGKLLTDSVLARDFPVILGIVFYMALIRIGANILADIAYYRADPRIRF